MDLPDLLVCIIAHERERLGQHNTSYRNSFPSVSVRLSTSLIYGHLKKDALLFGIAGTHTHGSYRRFQRGNILAEIQIYDGESIESALRRFKRQVQQEGIIKDVKRHSFFLKPGEKKRLKSKLAQKLKRKKVRRLPPDSDSKGSPARY